MFKNLFKTKEPSQNKDQSPNALSIGISVENNEKQFIDPSKAFGHTYISGQLGSGAKSLSINMAEEQIENGGGLVYLDIHGGSETLERLYEKSKSENRVDDLLIIDIQHPEKSNTYNPLKNGNSAEIAQKISCFFKHVEMKSPKLPCVSDDINEIHTIIMTLQKLGKEFGIDTIRNLVDEESCKGLLYLRDQLAQADIDPLLSSALEQIIKKYKIDSNAPIIDQHFENFITHHGACSQVLRSLCFGVDSDIDFVDVIKNKKNVYINLNGYADKVDAQILSQLITLDLRASLEAVGGDLAQKNDQPFILFSNDCLSLVDHSWARLYGYTNPSQFQMIHTNQEPLELDRKSVV